MTSTEQDNELREELYSLLKTDPRADTYVIPYRVMDIFVDFITADRKRVALEARIETAEHIQNTMVHEAGGYCDEILPDAIPNYIAQLKAQQEELLK